MGVMKSEYEFTDVENELYANSQANYNSDQEPDDKVTKWICGAIIVLGLLVIIGQWLKHK